MTQHPSELTPPPRPTQPDTSASRRPPTTGGMTPVSVRTDDLKPFVRQPRRNGGGIGCWIAGLVSLIVAAGLIAVGLFLPPFSLLDRLQGVRYTPLNAESNALSHDGLTLAVYGEDYGRDFGVTLDSVPLNRFLEADTSAGAWIPAALAAAPPTLALQSPVYAIDTNGEPPPEITLSVETPPTVGSADILDLYGYDPESGMWSFLPSHQTGDRLIAAVSAADLPDYVAVFQALPPDQPRVIVAVDVTQRLTNEAAQLATIVAPAGLQPTLQGSLTGSLAAGFDTNASYLVLPVIRNYADPRATDPDTISALLSNPALRAEHVAQIAAFAGTGYDGVLIDYRDLPANQRAHFAEFVAALGNTLDSAGLLLGVVVPAAQNVAGVWETGAYDWRAIGRAADIVQINLPVDPLAFEPGADRIVEALLRWSVGEIQRDKIVLGLSALSQRQIGGDFSAIGYDEALSALGDVRIDADITSGGTIPPGSVFQARLDGGYTAEAGRDDDIDQPYIDYLNADGSRAARMWLTTPEALRFRMDRTVPFALSGIGFEDLLANGVADGVYETILNYKLTLPALPAPTELALRWTIESAGGVLGEVTTGLNDPLVATIDAGDGNYAVNVAVVGGQAETRREGAAVAVFAPTLTPTPLPTSTPTPTPAPTRTPAAAAAAPAGGSGGFPAAPAPIAPGAGSIVVGNFEYGGHVTGTGTGAAGAMRRAGMTWMKVQLRYSPGMNPGAAADAINTAHGQGFKILLGIVGYPADLAAGGAGYVSQFASFLGGVASLGPDAIEVWNEPNIDREWPTGQISGAAYAEMLRQAYNAIKSANSGVMVISGAPAPTGAEAAFPGQVVNDDRFIREMVAAGAVQWMDCLGAHYNEGIVAPSQRSGDPRDNYYTRYFGTMLDTYWGLIGGQRPICFTELGYLTPEGYGALPSFFAWAQNVTVAQQAAWLAEAAALASQSGRVRLMIIWNIDFTFYGSDPMAGYAIIRQGGACPACDALAAAR